MDATPANERVIGNVGIVDDDESVRMAIRSLLRSLGFKVETFGSAEDLLGSARIDEIACLIVDHRLPGMSGVDLQRQLLTAKRELPMIFVSAQDDPVAQRQTLTAGALAFLRKPFWAEALIDAIRSGLSHQKGGPVRTHDAAMRPQVGGPWRAEDSTMDNSEQQSSATPKRDGAVSDRSDEVAHPVAMALANGRACRELVQRNDDVTEERRCREGEMPGKQPFEAIVGDSPPLRDALQQVEIVAPTDATVLVLGETGTGKELIARAIHHRSRRRARRFVTVNCAAIPSGLLESELFGHERGAFTGAIAQKMGLFEVANGGTLFLDEVGEIPLDLQPKLLRVLQDQEFVRIGGTRTIKVDVRVVAATNRDLTQMLELHRFRDDLYYRLNVFPICVPSLRERPDDIEPLVRHFVQRFTARMQRQIEEVPSETLDVMRRYPWPGNVRELENLIERAVILSPGPRLMMPLEHLARRSTALAQDASASTLELVKRAHVVRILEETNWTIGGPRGAATRLGMKRTTLQSFMKRHAIARRA